MAIDWGIVAGYSGTLVTGIIIGLVKPTSDWHFEKLRKNREYKEKIIFDCYAKLEEDDDRNNFVFSKEYAKIKPFLSEKAINEINENLGSEEITIIGHGHGGKAIVLVNSCIITMHHELSRLELEWGLK